MSTRLDPLDDPDVRPDRLHYATGVLLDRDDFLAEQLYHRGRLARALLLLHGTGTVAGLRVEIEPPERSGAGDTLVRVHAGVALDRLGRLVEVPRSACLRLGRWLENEARAREGGMDAARYFIGPDDPIRTQAPGADDEPQAPRPSAAPEPEKDAEEWTTWENGYLVADVFIRFVPCERGKTPAFASGPYDALDAVAPSRVRDGYALDLVLRTEQPPPVPADPWDELGAAGAEGRRRAAQRQVMDAGWAAARPERGPQDRLRPLHEHAPGQDPSSLFLARLFIPVLPRGREADPAQRVLVNNHLRRFVYPGPALAWLARQ